MSSSNPPSSAEDLLELFGQVDIYLFDQLLRGRITPRMRVLDAGCGGGRNSRYLMRCGADVFGIDADPGEVDRIRALAAHVAPNLPASNFGVGELSRLPFPDAFFDAVVCNAVLHFAETESEFEAMVTELWRTLAPGGVFFARLASSISMEDRTQRIQGRTHRLPDGTLRFLVDEDYLTRIAATVRGELLDPIKTTNVQNLRAMTTWVLGKSTGKP